MTRTFVDSGVLIAAARGEDVISEAALSFLADSTHVFVSSPFVRLEVLPKAIGTGQANLSLRGCTLKIVEVLLRSLLQLKRRLPGEAICLTATLDPINFQNEILERQALRAKT